MSEATAGRMILIVDDTEANRYTVSRILRQHGYAVREAADGQTGLAAALDGPDLVVLDVRLPDIDGFEICRRLKADPTTRDIPVLHISASFIGTEAKVRGLEGGADGYLSHPVEPPELVATIRSLLRARDAETRIRGAARQWTLTFDSISDPVCLTQANGSIHRCNRAFASLVRLPFPAILGEPISAVVPQLAGFVTRPELVAGVPPDEVAIGTRWYRVVISQSVPEPGHPPLLAWVLNDITASKQAESALRESREQLAFITDAAPVYLAHCDASGRYRFINRRYAERLGLKPEEVLGKHISEVVGHRAFEILRPYVEEVLRGTPVEFEVEMPYDRIDNRFMRCSYAPEWSEDGRVLGLVAVISDVTERRRAEEALRHTQKLESIGVLAGGIAHDFNNLLTGMLGNASLALRTLPASHPAIPMLVDVVRGSERAAALTAQLLAYAGKGRFIIEPLNVAELVRDIASLIRTMVPRNVQLELDLQEPLPLVVGDAGQLQQVVMNLVINGGEAIGERPGRVRVRASSCEMTVDALQSRFSTFDLAPGRYLQIEVSDDGSGMSDATRARVFEPFFTTKFLGRGLGLAAALGIVRSHHGGIAVASSPGQGTTFTVLLPEGEGTLAGKFQPTPRLARAEPERGVVLVVDDEELVRRAAASVLATKGYTVLEAADGQEALDVFREHADQVGLVILDMSMPVMSGDEAARHLRGLRPDLAIIATSGYGETEALRRFGGSGLAAFLQKPYRDERLLEVVEWGLTRWRGREDLPSDGGLS